MALSYEEALETLQAMFTDSQWTRETLDAVLRHQKGHMENTVDFILRHSGKDPAQLVEQLQAGINPDDTNTAMDAELARQLAAGSAAPTRSTSAPRGRGTPTTLPDDFLRIPGYTAPTTEESDAALARMLQNEMFANEVSRDSPEFANLAAGGRRRATGSSSGTSHRNAQTTASNVAPPIRNPFQGLQNPNQLMGKISEMGDNARKRLQLMAAQFNARNNPSHPHHPDNRQDQQAPGERRGLLDDNNDHDDDMELMGRTNL